MKRMAFAVLAPGFALACGTDRALVDAGGDASQFDASFVLGDSGAPCDVALTPATLPPPPPNCASCPPTAPAPNAGCGDRGLTCQYGSDPRFGCNPIYECDGTAWRFADYSAFASCGPVYEGQACDAWDAGCGAHPLCLRDGGVCAGAGCAPFLAVAPGCPCTAVDHAHLAICTGYFDLVCTDAGRFDGVGVQGLCGQ